MVKLFKASLDGKTKIVADAFCRSESVDADAEFNPMAELGENSLEPG
jgi:hypothetical protein